MTASNDQDMFIFLLCVALEVRDAVCEAADAPAGFKS